MCVWEGEIKRKKGVGVGGGEEEREGGKERRKKMGGKRKSGENERK